MGRRTSIYLSDDLAAAVGAAGIPLGELIRRGLAGAPAATPRRPARPVPAERPARREPGPAPQPSPQRRVAGAAKRHPCCGHCRHGANVTSHADPCTQCKAG